MNFYERWILPPIRVGENVPCLLAALFHMLDGRNRRERQRLLKAGSYLSQRALPLVEMSW